MPNEPSLYMSDSSQEKFPVAKMFQDNSSCSLRNDTLKYSSPSKSSEFKNESKQSIACVLMLLAGVVTFSLPVHNDFVNAIKLMSWETEETFSWLGIMWL